MSLSVDAGVGPIGGRDRVGLVLRLIASNKGRGRECIRSYFSCSPYLIIRCLLIRGKPNDENFNFPLLPPYLTLKWD